MTKSLFSLVIYLFATYLSYAQESEQVVTKILERKIADNGLYFDGQKRSNSDLNTDEPGFDYYFGRRITPHGDCIKRFGDYVFLTWWAGGEENGHVMLSRFNLKTEVLETIEFPHTHVGFRSIYGHIGDSHNTVAVGISPVDSTIHLLYDMHSYNKNDFPDTYFNYRISFDGAAAVADGQFTLALFKPKQTYLNPSYNYSDITYPSFFLNDEDELFVWFREGGHTNGNYKFTKYDGESWDAFTNFSLLNAKSSGNAYNWNLYGSMKYINGKLRVGFATRKAITNDAYELNNGFHYAYTNDPEGKNQWFTAGGQALSIPILNPEPLFLYEQGDEVTNGGANSVRIATGAEWTVTDSESIHFIGNNVKSNVDNSSADVHAFKKAGSNSFTISTDFPGGTILALRGDKVLLVDLNGSGRPVIYQAEGGTNDWDLIYEATSGLSFRHFNAIVEGDSLMLYLMQKGSGDAQPIHLQVYDLDSPDTVVDPDKKEEKVIPPVVWHWDTDGDLEGWDPQNGDTDASVTEGILTVTWSNHNTPKLVKSGLSYSTEDYRKVLVRIKVTPDLEISTVGSQGNSCRIVTTTTGASSKFFAFDHSSADEEFKTYIIDVGADPSKYSGTLTALQFQALRNTQGGNSVEITEYRLISAPNTWTGAESTEWNLACNWSENKIPSGEEIFIPLVANQPTISNLSVDVAELDLQDGVVLTVSENASLTILRDLKVTGSGHVIVESGSSLITYGAVAGANHIFERITTFDSSTGQYSAIGSPVSGENTTALGDLVYSYNENSAYGPLRFVEVVNSETMDVGNAYFSAYTGKTSFMGTPNTGIISVPLIYNAADGSNAGFNLVSNPYPAAVDFEELVTQNQGITGTIYLWDDGGSNIEQRDNGDYITVNMIGEVASAMNGSGRSADWNGYIGSTQGFFVKAENAPSTLTFDNEMKVAGNNDSASYFRKRENENDIQTLRLSLQNELASNQCLIGFVEDATEGYDRLYDAYKMDGANGIKLFSLIDDQPMAIQGLPKGDEYSIPLGIDVNKVGNYTLRLNQTNNWKEGKNIYLLDKKVNHITDLGKELEYSFSSDPVHENRFELFVSSKILSADQISLNKLNVGYSQNGLIISGINPQEHHLQITIIDMSGALLLNRQLEDLKETMHLDFSFDSNKVYILKVSNHSKSSVSKILFR
ncbi:MAG: BNR-4 repeat-containing protein [Cyclobacteriaceae bacterium]